MLAGWGALAPTLLCFWNEQKPRFLSRILSPTSIESEVAEKYNIRASEINFVASFKLLFKQKIWFILVSTNYLYDANVITQSSGGSRIFLRGRQLLKWWCQPIITGRNKVVAKVIFLHLSVIHSVHRGGGGLPQCMLGYPPWEQTPPGADQPPRTSPPRPGRPPSEQADPPPEQTPPGPGRPPRDQTPSDQADPPGPDRPPPGKQTSAYG